MRSVGRDQAAVGERLNARLVAQAALAPVLDRPGRQGPSRGVEHLDACVPGFRYVDRAVPADRDPRRVLELARLLAASPEIAEVYTFRSIPADSIGAGVGHEDVALVVDRDSARRPEPVWRRIDKVARRLPPGEDWRQIRREFLDAVVPCVRYIDIAGGVHRNVRRLVELPWRRPC